MECPDCGIRLALNDRTTKIIEFACPECHTVVIHKRTNQKRNKNTSQKKTTFSNTEY